MITCDLQFIQPSLSWGDFFIANLLPVTIGNIIGGSVMVGLVCWFIYIRKPKVSIYPTGPSK